MMKDGIIVDRGSPNDLILKHGRKFRRGVSRNSEKKKMNLTRIYGLF